ncbi:hypothetical protein DSO57_1000391 [Entomophthora muscae]|uniref:Uncharacterized protein n=1 Tax=Entomophthora muscae TaxID=34485 RepID=A0ACC2UIW8_9FUNG|nr:hypothetical protein DSO57_1000391 [Entomophthora muscae]
MTPPLTPQPDHPLEPTATAKTTSTQLFGVLYITLTGLVDSMVLNSRPWSLLGQSVSYIIKLAPILWWALPAGLAVPHPKPPKASTYNWFLDILALWDWDLWGRRKLRGQARSHGRDRFKGKELKVVTSQASYNVLAGNKNVLGSSRKILKHMGHYFSCYA